MIIASQRRAAARDEARRKDLRARGFHHERGGYHDKALNRYASRDPIAQTQGQTLEFLTEPDQLKDGSSSNDINNDYMDISDDHAQQHNGGAGLRIDSAVRNKKRDQDQDQEQEQDHIESAVSYQTPTTINHEIGTGQSTKDLF